MLISSECGHDTARHDMAGFVEGKTEKRWNMLLFKFCRCWYPTYHAVSVDASNPSTRLHGQLGLYLAIGLWWQQLHWFRCHKCLTFFLFRLSSRARLSGGPYPARCWASNMQRKEALFQSRRSFMQAADNRQAPVHWRVRSCKSSRNRLIRDLWSTCYRVFKQTGHIHRRDTQFILKDPMILGLLLLAGSLQELLGDT